MNESNLTLQDYWHIALRRKWWIIGSLVFAVSVAGTLCLVLPESYRSESLVLIEGQKIPENYVKGIIQASVEERLFVIKQQVMSRSLLGEIIEGLDLYPDERAKNGLDAVVGMVRGAIEIEMIGTEERRGIPLNVEAFRIAFSHEDPLTAMNVTSRITSRFIEENLMTREQFVEGAAEFLEYELERAKVELEKKEDEISRFKLAHMGALPQQMDANLNVLNRLQSEIGGVNEQIQRLTDQVGSLEKAIAEYASTGSISRRMAEGVPKPDPSIARLKELEEKLASLRAEYTDSYPDVVMTEKEIKSVKATLREMYGEETITTKAEGYDPYLQQLRRERQNAVSELAVLKTRRQELLARKAEYERRIERAPAVEQELLILLRDYENMKENYRSLLDKRLDARVAENLERRHKGEQFRVIDPANRPRKPSKPNRPKIMALGLIAGSGLGGGLVYLLELLNPVFRRPEEVEQAFGPSVVAAIPNFTVACAPAGGQRLLPQLGGQALEAHGGAAGPPKRQPVPRRRWRRGNGNLPAAFSVVARSHPTSLIVEQYRVAATRLSLRSAERESTIAVVTSAVKGEGKTTTLVNLGYTLAKDLNKRTLLVECDMKCPTLHQYAGSAREPGLYEIIADDVAPESCLSQMDTVPCWILPVGGRTLQLNELFRARGLTDLFTRLRSQFDYILLNAPPILPLADMNLLGPFADILLVVIRAGSTPQPVVRRAMETLKPTKPVYIVLNGVETQLLPYYMHYTYHLHPEEGQTV